MAQFTQAFDATTVAPNAPRVALPDGVYPMIIKDSAWERTKKDDGTFLELTLEVIDGQHKGRLIWDRLNLDNPNPKAVEIAQRTLSALCHATGVMKVSDSAQLHNIPILVTVKARDAENNDVKGYKKMDGVIGSVPAPTPAVSAPAAPAVAPWQRKAG